MMTCAGGSVLALDWAQKRVAVLEPAEGVLEEEEPELAEM
jgi:hypothetical protein